MTIRGETFDRTFGAFFTYERLAEFLLDSAALTDLNLNFIDLACGTGSLLKALSGHVAANRLYGIDIDERQLQIARSKAPKVHFSNWNLNNLSSFVPPCNWTPAMAHLGFCFFNTLEPSKRKELLMEFYNTLGITYLSFEIQNEDYQKMHYHEGRWYESYLSSGVLLRSKWTSKKYANDCRQLMLEFIDGDCRTEELTDIFPWYISDFIVDTQSCGWWLVEVRRALYRGDSIIPSHWFVICKRSDTQSH